MGPDRYLRSARVLFVVCLGLHIAAMFPSYLATGVAVVSTSQQTAEFICLEVGWALAAGLVMSSATVPAGVALGLGLGSVEIGFMVSDISTSFLVSNGGVPGHWLAVAGLMSGFAGMLVAASSGAMGTLRATAANRPRAIAGCCLAVLAVTAYFPNWESGVVKAYSGNAFLQPGGVMAGALLSALALAAAVVVGCLWQPPSLGAWGITGAAIALVSQLVSAYFQSEEAFPSSALQPGDHLALSGYWTADVAAVIGLLAVALWAVVSTGWPAVTGLNADPGPDQGEGNVGVPGRGGFHDARLGEARFGAGGLGEARQADGGHGDSGYDAHGRGTSGQGAAERGADASAGEQGAERGAGAGARGAEHAAGAGGPGAVEADQAGHGGHGGHSGWPARHHWPDRPSGDT